MEILNSFLCNWGSSDSNMLLFFLLIACLIGVFGGYLIWGMKIQEANHRVAEMTAKVNELNITLMQREEDYMKSNKSLESLIQKNNALSNELSSLNEELNRCQETIALNKSIEVQRNIAVETNSAKDLSQLIYGDDLKKIEGIGPKIEGLLHAAGILTYKQLSETGQDRLKEILETAGKSFQVHDPTTWPLQAALAHEGKWDELSQWQTQLKWGKS